jgi:hypothetical protein
MPDALFGLKAKAGTRWRAPRPPIHISDPLNSVIKPPRALREKFDAPTVFTGSGSSVSRVTEDLASFARRRHIRWRLPA